MSRRRRQRGGRDRRLARPIEGRTLTGWTLSDLSAFPKDRDAWVAFVREVRARYPAIGEAERLR